MKKLILFLVILSLPLPFLKEAVASSFLNKLKGGGNTQTPPANPATDLAANGQSTKPASPLGGFKALAGGIASKAMPGAQQGAVQAPPVQTIPPQPQVPLVASPQSPLPVASTQVLQPQLPVVAQPQAPQPPAAPQVGGAPIPPPPPPPPAAQKKSFNPFSLVNKAGGLVAASPLAGMVPGLPSNQPANQPAPLENVNNGGAQPPALSPGAVPPSSASNPALLQNSQNFQPPAGVGMAPQPPLPAGNPLPNAGNLTFVFNDGKILLYKTKTIAVPLEEEIETENITQSPHPISTDPSVIKVFDPSVGRTRNYVEDKIAVPLSVLVDLRIQLARSYGQDYAPERVGATVEEKLEEIKAFFIKIFGYAPMGIDRAEVLAVEDPSGVGLNSQVVIPRIFVPQEEKLEADTETGNPMIDAQKKQSAKIAKAEKNRLEGIKNNVGNSPSPFPSPSSSPQPASPSPSSLPTPASSSPLPLPSSTPSLPSPAPSEGSLKEIRSKTQQDIVNSGRALTPFVYNELDEKGIVNWINSFYASTTKDPDVFKDYTQAYVKDMVYEIMRYLIAGKSEKGTDFSEKFEKDWGNWLDTYLDRLDRGEIKTKDGSSVKPNNFNLYS